MSARLRRIAFAGNAAALALLTMALANAERLFREPFPGPMSGRLPVKTVVVILDALRLDASLDSSLMPNLAELAREGGRGTAHVESWVPSTVAGIRSIVEGIAPAPASFLEDFRASRAPSGGIFASAGRAFVAGPRLWTDLYGPWLAGSHTEPALGGSDPRILQAGLEALNQPYDLIVVHLSGPDDAAHLHGARSREYAEAVRRADAALGRLMARAGPATAFLVTSDHGVTLQGGHAGPEPHVLATPVVARLPGHQSPLGTLRQTELSRLLGLSSLSVPLPAVPAVPAVLFVLLTTTAATLLCHQLFQGSHAAGAPSLLDAAFWLCLLLTLAGWPRVALGLGLAVLAASPFLAGSGEARRAPWVTLAALAAGGLVAAFRISTGLASLSRLDVRLAFQVAAGPLGLPGAVAIVMLLQAIPWLIAATLLSPWSERSRGRLEAVFALVWIGQGTAAALALAFRPGDQVLGSLAVGLLLRLLAEVSFFYLGLIPRWRRSRNPAAIPP